MITYFLQTLQNILLPIFLQIALGFLLKKLLKFNVTPLVNIQFYLIIPALLFTSMYDMTAGTGLLWTVIAHTLLLVLALYLLGALAARIFKYSPTKTGALQNCVCLYNSGNFGIPLVQMLYSGDPLAMSVQMIVMIVVGILTNTLGIFNANRNEKNVGAALARIFKMPMIYAVILAFLLRGLHIGVWAPVWTALNSLGQALVPIALITLGAQLADTRFSRQWLHLLPVVILRLLISPAIAIGLALLLGLRGAPAGVVILLAAAPSAVNSVLMAIKYNNEPDFASEAVFLTTVLSSITVAVTISLLGALNF